MDVIVTVNNNYPKQISVPKKSFTFLGDIFLYDPKVLEIMLTIFRYNGNSERIPKTFFAVNLTVYGNGLHPLR